MSTDPKLFERWGETKLSLVSRDLCPTWKLVGLFYSTRSFAQSQVRPARVNAGESLGYALCPPLGTSEKGSSTQRESVKTQWVNIMTTERKQIDWELVEKHYRANIKTLREIGEEYGLSHVAIQKRAKTYGWSRDLAAKIQQKAQELVTKRAVTKLVTKEKLVTDAETIQEYGAVVAGVDESHRTDTNDLLSVSRAQVRELVSISRPEVLAALNDLARRVTADNEDAKERALFDYVVSLPSRIKMAKEIAATQGVHIPLQRKIYGLDAKESGSGEFENLLRAIGAQSE